MQFKNKLAVITGASIGIGREISLAFAKEGATIFLLSQDKKGLLKTQDLIQQAGGKSAIFVVDLSDVGSINKAVAGIKAKTKKVDILVNVAGIWHGKNEVYANKKIETFSQKVILDTYAVGFTAPTLLTHAFSTLMPRGSKIINISGTFENGAKGWLPYYASKRAIEDLTVGLAEELDRKDIQVNCISPSDTGTEAYKKYFPQYMADAIDPQKIADFAVHLCGGKAEKITGKVFVLKKSKRPYEKFHA